jgi:TPR repeat protein
MRFLLLPMTFAVVALAGCANQAPETQLKRKETVRVCQSGYCTDQASSTVTFQGEPVDAAAEQRLHGLTELAEQDARAAYDLGLRLLRGDGVNRDSYQGIQWLRRAGDQGSESAQLALGQLYLGGYEEMGADPTEAEAWLSRAAAQGNNEAQLLITHAQEARKVVREDYEIRAAARKDWGRWYLSAPYYWYWQDRTWYLR